MKTTTLALFAAALSLALTGMQNTALAQAKAAYGQQMFLLKSLKPSAKSVGVIGAALSDQEVQALTRAGMGVGLSVFVARPSNARDVAVLYKKLVSENKVDLILVAQGGGDWFTGASVEYLCENSVLDNVALCVPSLDQLKGGALCSIQVDNGRIVVHVDKKVANVVGASVPAEQSTSFAYVVR